MGFSLDISVPVLTVFFQGLISFFSPCVLPLIPLYIGYLSGGTGSRGEDGRIYYKRSKVMLHTLCFVIGVSFAFFLLGLCRPGFSQCPSDGGVSQHPGDGICADWRIYGRFCSAVPRSWPVYDIASGFFQESYERCQIYGENRRNPDGIYGNSYVHR